MFIPTAEQFQRAAGLSASLAARWYNPVCAAMHEFGINTPQRVAHFIAQIYVESAGFTRLTESLNYSPTGLMNTFGRRITPAQAHAWGRQPGERRVPDERQQLIANQVYSNRYGNGAPESGDGWRYRGHGLKQITFLDNHRECGQALGLDLLAHPELLERDEYAARSAGWYWQFRGCSQYADVDDVVGLTRRVNGGLNGLTERRRAWELARGVLCR